ncbi:hypothetical protein [Actinoallomurus sp. NPDC052274]|uniref:hypothetical protein n=1 Tax=Actinoallomurus sp. NPDC052274 TaxID=3155420 RepID=UPI003424618D
MPWLSRPRLLLADEPTSGLDVLTHEHILRLLVDLRRDLGRTLVLVTHDLRVVRRIADRVITLADGHIVEDLPADRLSEAESPETKGLLDATPTLSRVRHRAQPSEGHHPAG